MLKSQLQQMNGISLSYVRRFHGLAKRIQDCSNLAKKRLVEGPQRCPWSSAHWPATIIHTLPTHSAIGRFHSVEDQPIGRDWFHDLKCHQSILQELYAPRYIDMAKRRLRGTEYEEAIGPAYILGLNAAKE